MFTTVSCSLLERSEVRWAISVFLNLWSRSAGWMYAVTGSWTPLYQWCFSSVPMLHAQYSQYRQQTIKILSYSSFPAVLIFTVNELILFVSCQNNTVSVVCVPSLPVTLWPAWLYSITVFPFSELKLGQKMLVSGALWSLSRSQSCSF